MNHEQPPPRQVKGVACGTKVRITVPGWANGLTGTVENVKPVHEGARDREGRLIAGMDFSVRLDVPFRGVGYSRHGADGDAGYEITHIKWMMEDGVEIISRPPPPWKRPRE